MLNKKILLMLVIFFVSLLAVSTVSAADNGTDDIISDTNNIEDYKIINENSNDDIVLSSIDEDNVISTDENDGVLGASPPYNKYSVSVSDTTITYGSSGSIVISVTPCSGYDYAYDFYLKVYDSNNNVKINKNYYSSSFTTKITHSIGANELDVGTYTIKLVNYKDSTVMDTAKLTVKSEMKTPKITIKSITGKPGKKVRLTATVKDETGNKLKQCKITFKVNGKKYVAKTNSNGIATLKIKIPKSKMVKVSSKTKNKIVTKTTTYKKTYTCTASYSGNDKYKSSSTKFKVTSKNKKTQKYKIVKKQIKTITIPYKKWSLRKKTSGHYVFGVLHEQLEGNRITVVAGDKTLKKLIKFSSKAYYIHNGKKVYYGKNWLKSRHNTDAHYYYYTGDPKIYVVIKYNAYTYKKI